MEKQKLVSIIVPTYNCMDKIEKTIKSVLMQDKELYELIIVDGKSTDETIEVIKKYENSLRWISEKDKGIYDAMNKGISLSLGKYLFFLGAGDCLKEDVIGRIKDDLINEKFSLVYGNVYMANINKVYNGKYNTYKLTNSNICHQAIFYEQNIFGLVGKYELKYKILADYALNIKCFAEPQIKKKYINNIIADYEGDGVSCTQIDDVFNKDFPLLICNHLGFKYYLLYKIKKIIGFCLEKVYLKKIIKRVLKKI